MEKYQSQYKQDEYLDKKIFKEKVGGVFVDIGAHDGITLSNTYFFEKFREWKGLCIEPVPSTFKKLSANRNSININGCIGSGTGNLKFLQISGYAEMLSGLLDHYDEKHLERIDKDIREHGGSREIIEVPGYNLNELLKSNGIAHVDYCSIDTEGNEMEILKTIRFDEVIFDVFTIENNYATSELKNFMEANGYRLIQKLGCDEVYQRRNEKKTWQFWK